jgi:hypothetical protein
MADIKISEGQLLLRRTEVTCELPIVKKTLEEFYKQGENSFIHSYIWHILMRIPSCFILS